MATKECADLESDCGTLDIGCYVSNSIIQIMCTLGIDESTISDLLGDIKIIAWVILVLGILVMFGLFGLLIYYIQRKTKSSKA